MEDALRTELPLEAKARYRQALKTNLEPVLPPSSWGLHFDWVCRLQMGSSDLPELRWEKDESTHQQVGRLMFLRLRPTKTENGCAVC